MIVNQFEYYVFLGVIYKSVSGHTEEEPVLSTDWGMREQERLISHFRQPGALLRERQKGQE